MSSPIKNAVPRPFSYFIDNTASLAGPEYEETAKQRGAAGCKAHGAAPPQSTQKISASSITDSRHSPQKGVPSFPHKGQEAGQATCRREANNPPASEPKKPN
jgi:hypothetical protein